MILWFCQEIHFCGFSEKTLFCCFGEKCNFVEKHFCDFAGNHDFCGKQVLQFWLESEKKHFVVLKKNMFCGFDGNTFCGSGIKYVFVGFFSVVFVEIMFMWQNMF